MAVKPANTIDDHIFFESSFKARIAKLRPMRVGLAA
jgi:hypothetical protein